MPHLRFEPCQVLLGLEVVEVLGHRSFLEEVVEVLGHRSFLEEEVLGHRSFLEEEVLGHRSFLEEGVEEEAPFPPQVVEVVVEVVPFPPQVVEVVVEEVLRLQDLLEEVSVQSFCAPNRLIGVGKY